MSDAPITMAQLELLMSRMVSGVAKQEDVAEAIEQLTNFMGSVNHMEWRRPLRPSRHNMKLDIAQLKQGLAAGATPSPDRRSSIGSSSAVAYTDGQGFE